MVVKYGGEDYEFNKKTDALIKGSFPSEKDINEKMRYDPYGGRGKGRGMGDQGYLNRESLYNDWTSSWNTWESYGGYEGYLSASSLLGQQYDELAGIHNQWSTSGVTTEQSNRYYSLSSQYESGLKAFEKYEKTYNNLIGFQNQYDAWMNKDNPYTDFNVALDDREGANWNWIQKTYGSGAGQWYKDHLDEPWENNPHIDGYIPFTETAKMDAENKKLRETPNMENIASNAVVRRSSSNNNVMKIKTGSSSGTLGTGVVV